MRSLDDAVVKAVTRDGIGSNTCKDHEVRIRSLGGFLGELGLQGGRFNDWTRKYGANSRGISPEGNLLIPSFSIFSSIAWADIDPVILDVDQLPGLIMECDAALHCGGSDSFASECRRIRMLAICAHENGLCLKFANG